MIRPLTLFFVIFQLLLLQKMPADEKECPKLTGRIILKNSPSYDKDRLTANFFRSKESFPKAIVYCQTVEDVQNAVKWANCQGVKIRIRSGGHNHEAFSTGNDILVIDVSEMKALHINKEKNIAEVQSGMTGGELYQALNKEGLTQVGGTCEDVGISGLLLSGGMGPLARIWGLACDNILSFQMVNAEGKLLHVTPDNEHKELFWAACGGGAGNFGVMTSFLIKVYPAKPVTWFELGWNWEQPIEEVIKQWQSFFLGGDSRFFSHLDLWAHTFPSEKFKKMPVKVLGIFFGPEDEAKKELSPFLKIGSLGVQTIEKVDWIRAIKLFEESTATYSPEKPEYKSTGAYAMQPFSETAISSLLKTLKESPTEMLNVLFLCLGGKVKDKAPTASAYFYRNAEFFVVYSTEWKEESQAKKSIEEVEGLRESLLPYTSGDYVGNPDAHLKDPLTTYYGDNVERLKSIKKKMDPNNLFDFDQGIKQDSPLKSSP